MNIKSYLNQFAKYHLFFRVVTELHNNYVLCIVVTILCLVQSAHFNWKPLLILCRSGYDLDIFIQSRIVQVYTTVLQQFLQTWAQFMPDVWPLSVSSRLRS